MGPSVTGPSVLQVCTNYYTSSYSSLPFAKLRVQFGRGPGGNNGVSSIIRSMRTQDLWRLKCGVGRPPGRMDPADFVLRPFSRKEREEVDFVVQYGADLVEAFVRNGGDEARQRAGEFGAPTQ